MQTLKGKLASFKEQVLLQYLRKINLSESGSNLHKLMKKIAACVC